MIHCPQCQTAIPATDFNVATDLAYCRVCDVNHKYSELASAESLPDPESVDVPRHLWIDESGGRIELIYGRRSPAALFLVPFTLFWSGGSLAGIYGTQLWKGNFDLEMSLFGIPFVIGSIILIGTCLFLLFGKWRIRLDGLDSRVFVGLGPLGWNRPFDLAAVTQVDLKPTSLSVNNEHKTGIRLKYQDGGELVFGALIEDQSKAYIAALMKRALSRRS